MPSSVQSQGRRGWRTPGPLKRSSRLGRSHPEDRLDPRQDRLAIFPQYERHTVPDYMNDTSLDDGLRIDRSDRVGEAFEAVNNRDNDVIDAACLDLVDDLEPELGLFGLLIDRIRDRPTTQEPKRHADRLSMRSTDKRVRVSFTCSTRRHGTTSSRNCRYAQTAIAVHRIATPDQTPHPIFETAFSRPCVCGSRFEEPQVLPSCEVQMFDVGRV